MRRYWSRALVVALATIVAPQAATVAASAAPLRARAVRAPGVYEASFPDEVSASKLVIKADVGVSTKEGTFQFKTLRDSGTWVLSGTTIALFVTLAPRSNHLHDVFVGTLSASGISGGKYGRPDQNYRSWSATRGAARPTASDAAHPRSASRPDAFAAAGQYMLDDENGHTASFPVSNGALSTSEGSWEAVGVDPTQSGNWVTAGNHYAMGVVSGPDAGEVFIGTVTTNGISDAKSGARAITGTGVLGWRAVRGVVCSTSYTVDAAHGSDSHFGWCNDPFKTIKKALTLVRSGQSIGLDPGVYDVTNGETFPIAVPAGVTLIGDTAGRGTSPQTEIGGEVDLGATGSTVEGLQMPYVLVNGTSDTLIDSTIKGGSAVSGNCVDVQAATAAVVSNDTVTACQKVGVDIDGSGATVQLRNDSVTDNGTEGVFVVEGTADLGMKGKNGHNALSCNTGADLAAYVDVLAYGNYWDHVPPTVGTVDAAQPDDIFHLATTGVNSTFPMLAASPCT